MLVEALTLAAPGGFAVTAITAYAAPDLVRRRGTAARRVLAGLAALLAFAAHTRPTGLAAADALFGPLLAAAVTLLAARSRPWTVAGAAGVVAAMSITSPEPVLACISAGAGLAAALTARKSPMLAALVGALLVNAVLRLDLPGPHGSEVFAGAAILVPVCASGYNRMRTQSRRRLRRATILAAGVVVAAALVGCVALVMARPRLERAVANAGRGLAAARSANQAGAAEEMRAADDAFRAAERSLGAWWARPALAVPIIGPHLRALHVVADTGSDLAVAADGLAMASGLDEIRISDGQVPLDRLQALQGPLAAASAQVHQAVRSLRHVRSPWLMPPFARRFDQNVGRLADAERSLGLSTDVMEVLPGLLGAGGPRRWFLAVQTPSEARGSGGYIGNYGEITADGGRLQLARFGRIGELNQGGDPSTRTLTGPTDYVARYERFGVGRSWHNVNLAPDFPSVARVIAGLYPQSGGRPIDGVIAVDPAGVAALLQLTGPLDVPSWPVPLTAENAERILLFEQYLRFDRNARVDFLGETATRLWGRLTSGELPGAPQIIDALGPAVRGKHVLVSSLVPDEDAVLAAARINGRMVPVRGDSLAVVTQNASGNKIDWFLRRRISYSPRLDPSTGAISSRLTVTLENTAPAAGLPSYVIGSSIQPPLPTGTNRLYLSVYTPLRLKGARVDGTPRSMESERELGRRVYSTYIDIPPQDKVVMQLELAGQLAMAGEYSLDLHAQALVTPDRVSVTVADRAPRRLVLDRDRRI